MALCPPLVLADAILTRTEELRRGKSFDLKLPGLLVIDTPGVGDGLPWGGGMCTASVVPHTPQLKCMRGLLWPHHIKLDWHATTFPEPCFDLREFCLAL